MARRRRVVWAHEGRRTLDQALAYWFERSPAACGALLNDALRAAASLGEFGERGRIVPEARDAALREIFVRDYRMLYRVSGDAITIVAFVHSARDFARWRRRSGPD